jgi:DNA-binding CsgD family transcriptional regulator
MLLKASHHYHVYQVESLDELANTSLKDKFDFIFLNPVLIQGNIKGFLSARKLTGKTIWFALIYTFIDRELLLHFDEVLQITDSAASIIEKLNRRINNEDQDQQALQKEPLSDRETDVLRCLVSGLSNKEIADKLNISIHTVISHRKNISQKTGIKSLSGLTIFAISKEIISLDTQN